MVPIKLLLHKGRRIELHRVRGTFQWDELNAFIAYVMNWPHVTVQYTDADGDDVEISCQLEWEECLRLYRSAATRRALRLEVKRAHPQKPSCVPRLDFVSGRAPLESTATYVRFDSQHDESLMDLLSLVFSCDAPSLVFNTPIAEPLPWPLATRRTVAENDRVSLSLDMNALRRIVMESTASTSSAMMRQGEDAAEGTAIEKEDGAPHDGPKRLERMLALAMRVFGEEDRGLQYRMAVVKEQLGKRSEAIALLNSAKSLSLSAEQQAALLHSSAFATLLRHSSEVATDDNATVNRNQQLRLLLCLFPQADPRIVTELLALHNGNLTAVSQFL